MKKLYAAILAVCMVTSSFVFFGCSSGGDFISSNKDDLSNYYISAELDTNTKTVSASQKVEYKNNSGSTLQEVKFHLYPNAFREDAKIKPVSAQNETNAYPNGKSYGKIEVELVKANGKNTEFDIGGDDMNILSIWVEGGLQKGQTATFEIEFTDYLPMAAHRYGYTQNNYSLGNWYPVACVYDDGWVTNPYYSNGDPFYSDMANYHVTFTYPEKLTAASTGNFSVTTEGEKKILTSEAYVVRDFALCFSDKYQVKKGKAGDTTVQYLYFDDQLADENLKAAQKAVETFEEMIGDYPYESLCVAQTDFVYGGMEYPNLVFVSADIDDKGLKQVIVHEIAHQWWYNLVGNDQVAYAWMDEGLAEYSTALFFKKHEEYSEEYNYQKIIKSAEKLYTTFVDVLSTFNDKVDTSMSRATNDFPTEQEYVCMTYTKGMLMFEDLCFSVGESKFEKGLKTYFEAFKGKNAKPQDLIDSFSKGCGVDLQSFFDAWVGGTVVIGN